MIDDEELISAGAALHDRFGSEAADRFGAQLPDRLGLLVQQWGITVEGILDSGASAVCSPHSWGPGILRWSS